MKYFIVLIVCFNIFLCFRYNDEEKIEHRSPINTLSSTHSASNGTHFFLLDCGEDAGFGLSIFDIRNRIWVRTQPNSDIFPKARTMFSVAFSPLNNSLFIFGGNSSANIFFDLWSLDLISFQWSLVYGSDNERFSEKKGSTVPVHYIGSRTLHSMIYYNNSLYVFGGFGNGFANESHGLLCDIWSFNLVSRKWQNIYECGFNVRASQNTIGGRIFTNIVAANGSLYLYGGLNPFDNPTFYSDFFRFHLSSNTLHAIPQGKGDFQVPLFGHSLISILDKYLILFGGQRNFSESSISNTMYLGDLTNPNLTFFRIETKDAISERILPFLFLNHENDLFLFGGREGSVFNQMPLFDLWKFSICYCENDICSHEGNGCSACQDNKYGKYCDSCSCPPYFNCDSGINGTGACTPSDQCIDNQCEIICDCTDDCKNKQNSLDCTGLIIVNDANLKGSNININGTVSFNETNLNLGESSLNISGLLFISNSSLILTNTQFSTGSNLTLISSYLFLDLSSTVKVNECLKLDNVTLLVDLNRLNVSNSNITQIDLFQYNCFEGSLPSAQFKNRPDCYEVSLNKDAKSLFVVFAKSKTPECSNNISGSENETSDEIWIILVIIGAVVFMAVLFIILAFAVPSIRKSIFPNMKTSRRKKENIEDRL